MALPLAKCTKVRIFFRWVAIPIWLGIDRWESFSCF